MGTLSHVMLIIVLCFLLFSMIIIYNLMNTELFLLTKVIAYIGFIWMGALFLFFSINILIDIYKLIIHISSRIFSPLLLKGLPVDKNILIASLLIVTGITVYGWFEANHMRVERMTLKTAKLPTQVSTLRIVHISDTHFSPTNGLRLAKKITGIIEDLQPDILVSSGDLIDRGFQSKEKVAELFRDIKTTYGKYTILGNHDEIGGAVEFTEKAGFRMLRNENVTIGSYLNIAGIDDPAAGRIGNPDYVPEDEILKAFSSEHLNIFLKHQPRIEHESIGKFDIQLSSHTHGGQIFPFSLIVSLFYPYFKGLYQVGNDSYLYVSRGTGTWGPPIRFLAPPEITVIDFQSLQP